MPSKLNDVNRAVEIIKLGGIVAMPTESVYGLHCSAQNEAAIKKLLALKMRDADKGFILIAGKFSQLQNFIEPLPKNIEEKLLNTWPGPFTWVVPARKNISTLITGKFTTVAIRVTACKLIAQICNQLESPLISSSANISNQAVARNAKEVRAIFGNKVDLIIEGETPEGNKPTTIRDAFTDEQFR